MRLFLAARSLLMLVLIPGTVAGYIPWRILRGSRQLFLPAMSPGSILATGLALVGLFVLLCCVWDFLAAGRGTLAPFDPPKLLVVRGLYRFTRNPMYNGVVAMLLAEAWFFRSGALFQYAILVFVIFHLMVVVYEGPRSNRNSAKAIGPIAPRSRAGDSRRGRLPTNRTSTPDGADIHPRMARIRRIKKAGFGSRSASSAV